MKKNVAYYDLGLVPYKQVWELQRQIQHRLIDGKLAVRKGNKEQKPSEDVLLFVEHPHVFTLGKSGDKAHLLRSYRELASMQAKYVETDRGGDITYHGPGQIVGYPILDLDRYFTDIHRYLRSLEEIIIRTCADYDIKAGRIEGLTGVWVDGAKVCAMGVRCSRWVTMHGFALNVNTELDYFEHIIPCGIGDKAVTSLERILGERQNLDRVKSRILHHFEQIFNVEIRKDRHLPEMKRGYETLNPEAC